MADRPLLVGRQAVIGVQLGGERRGDGGGCIRIVAAKQDLSGGRNARRLGSPVGVESAVSK